MRNEALEPFGAVGIHAVRFPQSSERVTPSERPVLIVDDDLVIRESLAEILESRGYSVVSASNGLEALQRLRSMKRLPFVILLDLMMPVMDGYGFLEERAKDPALSAVPVALVTAGRGIDRDRLGKATRVVSKPIDMAQLGRLLEQLHAAAGRPR